MENRNEKGQLQRGHGGLKQKGALNKKTIETREKIDMVLKILEESIESDLMTLKPREKVELWMDLQEFIRPKLQRTQTDLTSKGKEITKISIEVINGSSSKSK